VNSRKKKDILIIILAFNEGENIKKVISDIYQNYSGADILVVNDGSFDNTKQVLKEEEVFLIDHLFNLGIGASLETGCQFAVANGYSYIVRMDADGQHAARFIKDILYPVKKGEVDITIGSRFLGNSEFKTSGLRIIGIRIISFVLTLMTRKKVTDPTSGFCAMNKKAFEFFSKNCPEDYPEPEILVYHEEFRIREIPITITKRRKGISSITPFKSIYYMVKVLFSLCVHVFKKETK